MQSVLRLSKLNIPQFLIVDTPVLVTLVYLAAFLYPSFQQLTLIQVLLCIIVRLVITVFFAVYMDRIGQKAFVDQPKQDKRYWEIELMWKLRDYLEKNNLIVRKSKDIISTQRAITILITAICIMLSPEILSGIPKIVLATFWAAYFSWSMWTVGCSVGY